ncbi:hypothetical protein GA0070609_1724 [Micromonospora echinaurantiaca]|uniref:DUF4185 domain-containing protein n=1 Tax=Micromonospora echinaurantiaca TaxID=47857 RepID=A0A1C5HJE0_9ACTN|nr:hypothetical protein [Micromonospora echinaurantiaca]SCG46098.1 hypothetical protein GA0070609_1724 [Micromonospora echinaurantiaca]
MRRPLALVSAAVVLAAAALTGGAAQAAPPAPATERTVGTARTPATPEPEATPPAVHRAKPFRAVPPPAREPGAKATPPDFGSGEKILSAYHRGKLSRDDAVRHGLAALRAPETVPAHLRPTGAIRDPQRYLTYLSMLAATAPPEVARPIAPDIAAPTAAPTTAAAYDDCAAEPYEYLGVTYRCRASAGEFLILYNIASGSQPGIPADYNPNGRAKAVQHMLNSLSIAVAEYREMGYPLPVRPDKPWVLVYGVDELPIVGGLGFPIDAPFVLPFGLNQQATMLVPNGQDDWDYLPRHELFHVMQYQYWDRSDVSLDYLFNFVGGKEFGSMNWWMEATAEWATHQTYVREPFYPIPGEEKMYARNVYDVLSKPGAALNSWGGLGGGPQYGAFLLPSYLTEQTDPNFVRRTWESVRDHDHLPIEAIRHTASGYGLNFTDMLLGYHIANYRLTKANAAPAPHPDAWRNYGYTDPDAATLWRINLSGETGTSDDGLGSARPARKKHSTPAGTHVEYQDILRKGGAVYHDFWAVKNSGDSSCGYCSTLLVDVTKDANRSSAVVIWSRAGGGGTEYPSIQTVRYPDAGGLITVPDFTYPMVATLVSTWTELDIHSADAADSPKTFSTYVETTLPLKPRSCTLRPLSVQSVEINVEPEGTFNRYAASTPDGWTGGDSTYSVKLPDGRIVWLFSDTWMGPLNADGTRPLSAPLVNNTFVVQNGGSLTTYHGGTAGSPQPLMPPSGPGKWYWVGDGHLSDGQLQVVYQEYERFGSGAWDWRFNRNVVANFALSNLREPVSVRELPSASGVAWGSALLPASRSMDGFTYIYGVDDSPINKQMRIARVYGDDLADGTWQYHTPWGWTFREQSSRNLLTGIANEYSVTPWRNQFLLLSQDSTEAFSGQINAWTSCSPFGPFTQKTPVYRMPEPGPYGSYWNPNVISYNAHVHASLSSGDTFLASYNVNSMDTRISPDGDHYRDPGIYRPRFFRFVLG